MERGRSLGLDEIMIINPSNKGELFMLHQPYIGNYFASSPEGMGYYGHYAEGDMGYGQYPEEDIGYYGQYDDDDMGYGQYPEEDMGYYGQYSAEDMGYGQYPEEEFGDYGQYPQDDMGEYGQYPDDDPGYGQYEGETMADYGDYSAEHMQGYVPEVEPPFNPRGDFGTQLSGYEREKTVNPTCVFQKPADITPITGIPDIFKPYL